VAETPARRSQAQLETMVQRERTVMQERIKGKGWAEIEREHRIARPDLVFKRAIARPENDGFARAEAIRLEEHRLDALQEGLWEKAMGGDARATEVILKALERRAKMLGLDFSDTLRGQLVQIEEAKVRLMAAALVAALDAVDLGPDAKRVAADAFFAALRSGQTDT
jgi:hypothetical protein